MGKTERTDQEETFLKFSIPDKLFWKVVNDWY